MTQTYPMTTLAVMATGVFFFPAIAIPIIGTTLFISTAVAIDKHIHTRSESVKKVAKSHRIVLIDRPQQQSISPAVETSNTMQSPTALSPDAVTPQ